MAETIRQIMPNMEMVRMVNSGTEANYECHSSGAGVYRPRQNREIRSRCLPCHADRLLVKAGSGAFDPGASQTHQVSRLILPNTP